jgi:[acyl-carrier-protein] S-malonyltransferase
MVDVSKAAYVFPGQGSQSTGMGLDLYERYPAARAVFDAADACLGFPLSHLCFEGPEDELTKTHNVQPAILVVSIACLKATEAEGITSFPSHSSVAGHSLGEYTALVVAGAIDLTDALLLVRERGRLMYEAGLRNPGSMLAVIGLDEETVREISSHTGAEISNINCPGQIVVSGSAQALAEAGRSAKANGARVLIPLKVSGAFHSALMEPVMAEFSDVVSSFSFHSPAIPVISNVTARPLTDVDSIKEELVKQLRNCIQWQASVEYMIHSGVKTFCEIGPGRVLNGLIRRINPEVETFNVSGVEDIAQLVCADNSTD